MALFTLQPDDVSYLKNPAMDDMEGIADDIIMTCNENRESLEWFANARENAEPSATNIRRASLFAIGSIRTYTEYVDANVSGILKNYGTIKDFLESTRDGGKKWELCQNLYNSEIPEKVSQKLKDGEIQEAHAILANRNPNTGERYSEKWYLRTVKASFVLYLLGYETMCLDKNVFQALPMRTFVKPERRAKPSSHAKNHKVLRQCGKVGAQKYHLHQHKSVDDMNHDFWCDGMQYNPVEYNTVMNHIVEKLDMATILNDIPQGTIPQILFNIGRNRGFTVHRELMEQMDGV